MIGLLPIATVIRWIAGCYAAIVLMVAAYLQVSGHQADILATLRLAFAGGAGLQIALLAVISIGWRVLWRWFPVLGVLFFPDLNGNWDMTIHWRRGRQAGTRAAVAIVKQNLVRMSIEVIAPDSDSQTLSVLPKLDPESSVPLVHYIYRVTPHAIGSERRPAYEGAAILRVDRAGDMHGNYWTTSPTTGHFVLKRVKSQ